MLLSINIEDTLILTSACRVVFEDVHKHNKAKDCWLIIDDLFLSLIPKHSITGFESQLIISTQALWHNVIVITSISQWDESMEREVNHFLIQSLGKFYLRRMVLIGGRLDLDLKH
ncbi:hypothetical protein A4A49_14004 [Nicotiana attenuata]|uniref:Uncharacterized protein n=1 Tax=Nicotiana attenuata TaxID=49451 RepID=A0A314KM00_NICAT|nr:hypothetical protein A4A49_14004 [Nicotiana attenuata]